MGGGRGVVEDGDDYIVGVEGVVGIGYRKAEDEVDIAIYLWGFKGGLSGGGVVECDCGAVDLRPLVGGDAAARCGAGRSVEGYGGAFVDALIGAAVGYGYAVVGIVVGGGYDDDEAVVGIGVVVVDYY